MSKCFRILLSLALAVMMVVSIVPFNAKATTYTTPEGYDDYEYQKMVDFLEQTDWLGRPNGQLLFWSDYDPADPATWWDDDRDRGVNWDTDVTPHRVVEIELDTNNVGDLDVHNFTALTYLNTHGASMGTIDASGCTALSYIDCHYGYAEELNIEGCTELFYLNCADNELTELDVSACTKLEHLECENNMIEVLDVSNCTKLDTLTCDHNNISVLDVSNCTLLEKLNCHYNNIDVLDVSGLTALYNLNCSRNNISTLNVANCKQLQYLRCNDNNISTLSVSGLTKLISIYCQNNNISKLVPKSKNLKYLWCYGNKLTTLNTTSCTVLKDLECGNNLLTSLSYYPDNLVTLYCESNQLKSIDISECGDLDYFNCSDNQIAEIDAGGNAMFIREFYVRNNKLTELPSNVSTYYLDCGYNELTSIDTHVYYYLKCNNNKLSELDLSEFSTLDYLDVDSNLFTSLDVSCLPSLGYLSCYNNSLTSLDVSSNTVLRTLFCSRNKLTQLDVSNNPKLFTLSCRYNQLTSLDVSKQKDLRLDSLTAGAGGTIGYSHVSETELDDTGTDDDEDEWDPYIIISATTSIYAVPNEGYKFVGWYDADSNSLISSSASLKLNDDITATNIKAKFKKTLSAPTMTLSTVESTGKVKVSWEKVDGAAKYEVWRCATKEGTYKKMITTTNLSYTNTGAAPGDKYYYKVRAIGSDGSEGPFCSPKYRYTRLPQAVVTGGHVADTGKNKLTWEAVDGAEKYEVWRAASKTGDYKKMITTTNLSYTNTSAEAGKTYYYKVVAVHSETSANSTSAVKGITCDLPRPVVSISLSGGKPKLTWKAIEGAVSYEIWRRVGTSGSYSKIKTTTSTSFTNTGAAAGTTYYYKVIAVHSNTNANSAYSAAKHITSK